MLAGVELPTVLEFVAPLRCIAYVALQPRLREAMQPIGQVAHPGDGDNPPFLSRRRPDNSRMERLNKLLAHAGVGSRRFCDELIVAGRVRIDGKIVRELGTQLEPNDHQVMVDDHPIHAEKFVYWAVNKPRGYLCSNHDPSGRPLMLDLVPHIEQRVYTVGRLDEDSEGLLLLTNDGDLANGLMHPRYAVEKTYEVLVAGSPSGEDIKQLLTGVWLSDGRVKAGFVKKMKRQGESTWLRVVLSEGKNREIRRMLAKLGHKVMRLKRTAIGTVRLDRLPKGKSRKLGQTEVESLRRSIARRSRSADDKKPAPEVTQTKRR